MARMHSSTTCVAIDLRKPLGWLGCSLLLAWCGARAGAADVDPLVARGEQIAQQQCSACHIVASKQELPPVRQIPTPSFEQIANWPGRDEKFLRRFIASTHWDGKTVPMSMPEQLLTNEETIAVARYIVSLRKPGPKEPPAR